MRFLHASAHPYAVGGTGAHLSPRTASFRIVSAAFGHALVKYADSHPMEAKDRAIRGR
ncbi:hypothetical protein [Streptomyces sp. A0958]|uniref:hypothetical protein n=1 Tax=Streptomyces sp. A0958 TaxID=2563101 RepID=UPI001446A951|nr:hypothetical protein [Streptomyces sp. A0958]